MKIVGVFFAALLSVTLAAAQAVPEWIWHANDGVGPGDTEVRYFRKSFRIEGAPRRANLSVAADNHFVAYVNGQKVGEATGWDEFRRFDIAKNLKAGENVVAVEGRNDGGPAGLMVEIELRGEGTNRQSLVSDATWQSAATADAGWQGVAFQPAAKWVAAKSLGKMGVQPWGMIAAAGSAGGKRESSGVSKPATPAESISVPDGFKVELLRSAQLGEGSWVAMTVDPQGRLIISPQGKEPMLRITLDAKGPDCQARKTRDASEWRDGIALRL